MSLELRFQGLCVSCRRILVSRISCSPRSRRTYLEDWVWPLEESYTLLSRPPHILQAWRLAFCLGTEASGTEASGKHTLKSGLRSTWGGFVFFQSVLVFHFRNVGQQDPSRKREDLGECPVAYLGGWLQSWGESRYSQQAVYPSVRPCLLQWLQRQNVWKRGSWPAVCRQRTFWEEMQQCLWMAVGRGVPQELASARMTGLWEIQEVWEKVLMPFPWAHLMGRGGERGDDDAEMPWRQAEECVCEVKWMEKRSLGPQSRETGWTRQEIPPEQSENPSWSFSSPWSFSLMEQTMFVGQRKRKRKKEASGPAM
jgi:hypothetical protein